MSTMPNGHFITNNSQPPQIDHKEFLIRRNVEYQLPLFYPVKK